MERGFRAICEVGENGNLESNNLNRYWKIGAANE